MLSHSNSSPATFIEREIHHFLRALVAFILFLGLLPQSSIRTEAGAPFRRPDEGIKWPGSQRDTSAFINDINGRIETARARRAPDAFDMEEARAQAFRDWAHDHHQDIKIPSLFPDAEGSRFSDISNKEVPSNVGVVDLDWLATMGNIGARGPMGKASYILGKELWFLIRQADKDRSTFYNTYPDTNWRAVAIADRLSSGEVSAEEVFDPKHADSPSIHELRNDLNKQFKLLANFSVSGEGRDQFQSHNHWSPPKPPGNSIENPLASPNGSTSKTALTDYAPSKVGGVYLRGAGSALRSLGITIAGFRFDSASGVLSLITRIEKESGLQRLRLDDIVTVFQSVYAGSGPTVTINPDPKDPRGDHMQVIADPVTSNTFVHWVTYQADRIMKCYNLAKNNLTGHSLDSNIPGYDEVVASLFFPTQQGHQSVWERFWIVPGQFTPVQPTGSLTWMSDFPLKVLTQRCRLINGILQDDYSAPSSVGARIFSGWFTENYALIGKEHMLTPPVSIKGSKDPINVLATLQSIAAVTALAENLRDQGIPMPAWMANYRVQKIEVNPTTPALTSRIDRQIDSSVIRAQIYGGVELTFDREESIVVDSIAAIEKLPKKNQTLAQQRHRQALGIDNYLAGLTPVFTPTVREFQAAGDRYRVTRLPLTGEVLGACQLHETDMELPLGKGSSLKLVRHFNSFFNVTDGIWGSAWNMNLPRLEKSYIPIERNKNSRTLRQVYDLRSPLDSDVRFNDIGPLKGLKNISGTGFLPNGTKENILALIKGKSPLLNLETHQIWFKNSEIWHFSESGRFVASERKGAIVLCSYSKNDRLIGISGNTPGEDSAEIRLAYDRLGRLSRATGIAGRIEQSVNYQYGPNGNLIRVLRSNTTTEYRYQNDLVVSVVRQDAKMPGSNTTKTFTYDKYGRVSEQVADGVRARLTSEGPSPLLRLFEGAAQTPTAEVLYGLNNRPIEYRFDDGSEIKVTRKKGRCHLILKDVGGQQIDIETPFYQQRSGTKDCS